MKAAIITQPRDGIGENTSIGIIALSLARSLSRLCDVIVFGKKNPRLPPLADTSPQLQYEYVSVAIDDYFIKPLMKILLRFTSSKKRTPVFAMQIYYLAYITLTSIKIRTRKCDVIHIHNYTQFIPIARFFNPKAKIIIQMNCEWLTQLDRRIMYKRLMKADLILNCSSYITQKNRERFPEIAERFDTFYNGVDTQMFRPENKRIKGKEKKTILFIGRVSPEKGVHILIEAFSAAARKFSDIDLVITGHKGTSDFISE
ncbi:MAG: glycosyltransferase family 4 protein, partial [Syntrophothermus sp.]